MRHDVFVLVRWAFVVVLLSGCCFIHGQEIEPNDVVVIMPPSSENCFNPSITEGETQIDSSCRNNLSESDENHDVDVKTNDEDTVDGVVHPPDLDVSHEDDGLDEDHEDHEEDDDEEEEEEEDNEPTDYSLSLNTWSRPQIVYDINQAMIKEVLTQTEEYMNIFLAEETSVGKYKCRNYNWQCSFWASEGDCDHDDDDRRKEMVELCSPACQTCEEYLQNHYNVDKDMDEEKEGDDDDDDEDNKDEDEPHEPEEPGVVVPSNWGVSQYMVETGDIEKFQTILSETDRYMTMLMMENPDTDERVLSSCENGDQFCTYWAVLGECETSQNYMHLHCGPACSNCDRFDYHKRCPIPEDGDILKEPGDLNKIFERIVTDPYWADTYGPLEILSSPESTDGPWIITLENFLKVEECTAFIAEAEEEGYERSEDEADEDSIDGTLTSVQSDGRTSTNTWCFNSCMENPMLKPVHDRLETLTGVPNMNSENLQLLKYEVGQFYEEHHDYSDLQREKSPGPRILTAFMYLNDVEGGGGTRFRKLNLTVQPKRGKMLLWPSVIDANPLEWDPRTMHEALPVTAGQKHGSNAWFHLRDFKGPNSRGCV